MKVTIVYGDPGERDPYIIKRVESDYKEEFPDYYEVFRNDSELKWRYRWIADASTYTAAKRRMMEDYAMQIRLLEARQRGLEL